MNKNFFKVDGYIYNIMPSEDKGKGRSPFYVRDFVLEIRSEFNDKTYTELVNLQLKGDKVSVVDHFSIGDNVTVSFSLSGREWTNKATGITKVISNAIVHNVVSAGGVNGVENKPVNSNASNSVEPQPIVANNSDDDDLPF